MAFTSFDAKVKEIEQENEDYKRTLCTAHGCPMEWTVDAGRRLCPAHAWADPHDWPRITDELITKQALGSLPTFNKLQERAMQRNPAARVVSTSEKREILNNLRHITRPGPKDWARQLKAKELAGEHLSNIQKGYWRVALGEKHEQD